MSYVSFCCKQSFLVTQIKNYKNFIKNWIDSKDSNNVRKITNFEKL